MIRVGAIADSQGVLARILAQFPGTRAFCLDIEFLLTVAIVVFSLGKLLYPVSKDYVDSVGHSTRTGCK